MSLPRSQWFAIVVVSLLGMAPVAGAQSASSTSTPPEGWGHVARWQAALHDGSYIWELTRPALHGDTLVGVQADTVVRVPLQSIDELRLLSSSEKRVGQGARATFGALAGADDSVYELQRFAPSERRRIVEQALAEQQRGAPRG